MSQLLSKAQLLEVVPYSHTQILRLENDQKFPLRIKPYGGRNGKCFWLKSEIDEWIQSQVDQRDNSLNVSP